MKKNIRIFPVASILIALSLQVHAQGFVYDQQSANVPFFYQNQGVDFFDIQPETLTQSFIPTLSTVGFVQFEFIDPPNNGNNGATVYVNLWTGSANTNAAIFLGSTAPVYMPNGFGYGYGVTNFYFATPIALTLGQTYYLQPIVKSGDNPWDVMVLTNTYPNGQLYGNGTSFQPSIDLWFREGVVSVPEPCALALIGLSSLLAFYFKRRSKLLILSLFSASVLSVYSQSDSVVQATAENAGLASATVLPRVGTYWVITVNANGNLTKMPYPMMVPELSGLPIYEVTNGIFIVDDTGGHISSARMSRTQSAAIAQGQANDVSDLVSRIQTADDEKLT